MLRYIFVFCVGILLAGCHGRNQNQQCLRYHDDGRSKPMVTIVPMLDSTCYEVPWSVSDEFTSLIKTNLSRQGNIFIPKGDLHLSSDSNPFETNINWVKKEFNTTEFVVFLELIEHEDIPIIRTVSDPSKIPESRRAAANLNMAIRLRIVDVRSDKPKIVLQEMLKDTYYMPNNIDRPNYNVTYWGTDDYKTSPLGIAHAQFAKQVIERINDYVMLAKSR